MARCGTAELELDYAAFTISDQKLEQKKLSEILLQLAIEMYSGGLKVPDALISGKPGSSNYASISSVSLQNAARLMGS